MSYDAATEAVEQQIKTLSAVIDRTMGEIGRRIVGQKAILERLKPDRMRWRKPILAWSRSSHTRSAPPPIGASVRSAPLAGRRQARRPRPIRR